MRKTIAYLTLPLGLLCFLGLCAWTAICIDDYQAFLATSNKDGADYLAAQVGYGMYSIGFFLISAVNLVSALVCLKCGRTKFLRVAACISLSISALGFVAAIALFLH